jgi:small subunit ribosomal protein S16
MNRDLNAEIGQIWMSVYYLSRRLYFARMATMLMIRLQRIGRKHQPAFRLVLTDSKNSTKSGRFLEILGNYDSRRGEKSEFKSERISYWMSKGAKATDTVHNLLIDKKIISGKKLNKLPKKTPLKTVVSEEKPVSNGAGSETADVSEAVPESVEAPVEEVKTEEAPATLP